MDANGPAPVDLRSFLAAASAAGLVDELSQEVDPAYELAGELARRDGRVACFPSLPGGQRAIGGLASSRALMALALGVAPESLIEHLGRILGGEGDSALAAAEPAFEAVETGLAELADILPPVRFYREAPAPYLTAGIIAARSEHSGMNYSFHRMMLVGGNRMTVRVVPRHLNAILDEGARQAEVAVLLGLHPALSIASACSGPPELDELELASRLAGRPIAVTELAGLVVPARAELVLRGRFTGELADEGPFVDITGTLDGVRQQPVLEISQVYSRERPWVPSILPASREHCLLMGLPQEPRIWNGVKAEVPGLSALALSQGGCSWLHAVVAIRSPEPGQARTAGLAALAAHPSLKRVVVVDEDVDPTDAVAVEWAIATRCQPDRDVFIPPRSRGSSLDPSRDEEQGTTAKWVIDATIPPGGDRDAFRRIELPGAGS